MVSSDCVLEGHRLAVSPERPRAEGNWGACVNPAPARGVVWVEDLLGPEGKGSSEPLKQSGSGVRVCWIP